MSSSGIAACILACIIFSPLASAQTADPPPIISDRPDFTESPVVVPAGFVQLETGLTHQRENGEGILSIGEGLLRIPLSSRLEARLGIPSLYTNGVMKVTDSSIGVKLELPSGPQGYEFGLIAAFSLPTGQSPLSAETVVPSVILATGGPLTGSVGLGAQVAASLPEQGSSRTLVSGATLVVSSPLTDRTGAFVELAGEAVEFEDLHLLSHAGFTYSVDASRQLDVHFGSALTDDAPDVFIGFGFVYRR